MPLFSCPDCNNNVSTNAESCPHCGNTDFYVLVGNLVKKNCGRCGGEGKLLLGRHRHQGEYFSSYGECPKCNGLGKRDSANFKNLQTGKVSELYLKNGKPDIF